MEDITRQLDRMNVEMVDVDVNMGGQPTLNNYSDQSSSEMDDGHDSDCHLESMHRMRRTTEQANREIIQNQTTGLSNQQPVDDSSILLVTNVDPSIFTDKLMQSKFESLFLAYDNNVTFRYLKSFRRVRLDFSSSQSANLVRINLARYKLGSSEFKCYGARMIRARNNSQDDDDDEYRGQFHSNQHLMPPKLTKQFLISPPASPPVGWEPSDENSPCIDVQLMSAMANLVPGMKHEIHQGNESQPGIYVEVCEDPQFENPTRRVFQKSIPKTMSPGFGVAAAEGINDTQPTGLSFAVPMNR